MTAVNIAVQILSDAFSDQVDSAILVSANSELLEIIQKIKVIYPTNRIIVTFPPRRNSVVLQQ